MLRLFREGKDFDDLRPTEETVVEVLTRDERALISRIGDVSTGLGLESFAINLIKEGDRGFGEDGNFYSIDVPGKRIFKGEHPFGNIGKIARREHKFLLPHETTVDDLIEEFREAGFEILDRTRDWRE